MPNLSDKVSIPPKQDLNAHLSSAREDTMIRILGTPGPKTPSCSEPTGDFARRIVTRHVGPFRVRGYDAAVDSLERIFAEVRREHEDVFNAVQTEGMLCVRSRRHNPNRFSNHSWGCAIDLFFGSEAVPQGEPRTHRGTVALFPFFNKHGWYWGAEFSGDSVDTMHFELAEETILTLGRDGGFEGDGTSEVDQPAGREGGVRAGRLRSALLRGEPDLAAVATGARVLVRRPGKQLGVGAVQLALNRLGARIDFGPGDRNLGVFGPQTEEAVDVFQARAGVIADGQVGRDTIAALDKALLADEAARAGGENGDRDGAPGRVGGEADPTPPLFDFAQGLLGAAQGVPWSRAQAFPAVDGYSGVVRGSCYVFHESTRMPNHLNRAVFYGSKLAIDNDGRGGNAAGDPAHQNATTLRDASGRSLDAERHIFAVLPMDADEAERAHRDNPAIALKHAGLPDFGRELGLKLGDLGVAFWRRAGSGSVNRTFFIYGDKGPTNMLGEGSVRMADELRIASNPNTGGLDASEIAELRKGVIHIAFPGSGAAFLLAGHANRTTLDPAQVAARAAELLEAFTSQTA
jgi:hypothetical protein